MSYFYKSNGFGKEKTSCEVLFNLGLFKVIRFETRWDNGAFNTWRTRIKFYWNVGEG